MTVLTAIHIGIGIECPFEQAYAFTSNPENLPLWAAGLAGGITRSGDEWIITTPQGEARLRFAPINNFGILDHTVTLAPDVEVHVPMRMVRNADGCEVILTLYRQPGMDDAQFQHDANLVRQDLNTLKQLLESKRK